MDQSILDLYARIPLGVIVKELVGYKDCKITSLHPLGNKVIIGTLEYPINMVKQYLRSFDKMTDKEKIFYNTVFTELRFKDKIDWLNIHMLDYRGLIPINKAIEAPDDMYKENKEIFKTADMV